MRTHLSRGVWLVVALLALALGGCDIAATHAPQPTVAPRATATATPLPTLTWTPVKLPTSFNGVENNLAISPVDGHDAWMCQATSANTYAVWKTTDAGVTWSKTGGFSYTAPIAGAECGLNADQNGTSALMATITWGCGECGNLASANLFSADGATNWRTLSGYAEGPEFASVPGGFIAIVSKTASSQQNPPQYLAFSADGFHTWRAMSPKGLPTQFFQFAVSPDGATIIGSGYNNTLWRSTDLGAHWTQLPTPDGQTWANWLSQRGTFLLCGGDDSGAKCSTDLGAHWYPVKTLSYTEPCPDPGKCGQGVKTQTQQCGARGVEANGALVALCEPNQTTPFPTAGPASSIVYLLPLGATDWQPVGVTHCAIAAVPASGPVWCSISNPDQLLGYATGRLPG